MTLEKKLKSGWTWDAYNGAVCHFQHHPTDEAERIAEIRKKCFVVETINWTIADGDKKTCHLNEYFAPDMPSAISLAARMENNFADLAEDVVRIRPATEAEETTFWRVYKHFEKLLPDAISEQAAEALADND
jgi:hypothetical protein